MSNKDNNNHNSKYNNDFLGLERLMLKRRLFSEISKPITIDHCCNVL